MNWLWDWDTNTRFFHAMTSARKRKNTISKLTKDNGDVVTEQMEIGEVVVYFFRELFRGVQGVYEEVLQYVDSRLNEEENEVLLRPLDMEEFKLVLFQLHSNKTLGPDGLNLAFFKQL